jgi:hypothetical protein
VVRHDAVRLELPDEAQPMVDEVRFEAVVGPSPSGPVEHQPEEGLFFPTRLWPKKG